MKYRKIFPKFSKIHKKIPFKTLPNIHKSAGIYLPDMVEITPIIFDHKFLLVMFEREGSKGTNVLIFDYFSKKLLSKIEWPFGLGSSIVVNQKIHLFGSEDWDSRNYIQHAILEGIDSIKTQETIWKASENQKIYNTSVCSFPDGFIMVYEVAEPNVKNFSIRFLKSTDLSHWEPIGDIFHPDIYAACPTIRHLDGWFYVFYLVHENCYLEQIARTKDFLKWEDHLTDPQKNAEYCGINNSDIDLLEYEGNTYLFYADGNQHGWGDLRTAIYPGSFKKFVNEFFL